MEKSARITIEDSRRYGKPVIPFIWPNFHDSMEGLGGTQIPIDFWNRELALVKEYADGAYVWNNHPTDTDEPWLAATIAASEPAAQASAPLMVSAQSLAVSDDVKDHHATFSDSPIAGLLA